VAESPLSPRNEIWRFFFFFRNVIYVYTYIYIYVCKAHIYERRCDRSHLLYISSFFKYFPNTTTRLLSSNGNKNIVNLLLPRGRRVVETGEYIAETLSVHIRTQYHLGGFMFILTLENGNGKIFSVGKGIIEYESIPIYIAYGYSGANLYYARNKYLLMTYLK